MDQPTFAVADRTYPNARVVDEQEHGGVHNLLLATECELGIYAHHLAKASIHSIRWPFSRLTLDPR